MTVLICGPGGIGKTTLLRWVEEDAVGFGMTVRWGHCLPGVTDPFFPIDQLFRSSGEGDQSELGASDTYRSHERVHPWAQLAAKGEKPSSLPVALVSFAKPTEGELPPPGSRAPATVLLEYLLTLEREVRTNPFVLMLDDFQWADQDSVQALQFLSRNIRNLPVLMAVTLREDEVEDPAFVEVLRDLRRQDLARDIHLKGLDESAARQLLESIAQGHIDPDTTRAALRPLLEHTGGNPYFLLETIRQLQEGGRIRSEHGKAVLDLPKTEGTDGTDLPMPASISDLLTKRLLTLSSDERELLEVAALVGKEFKAAPLKHVLGASDEKVGRMLRKLTEGRGLLLRETANELHYAFAHALLWETVRNSSSSAEKREWSGRLASWWETHEPADVEKIAALYHEGGVSKKGLKWTEKAIAISLQAHAHKGVSRHFAIGLGLMDMDGASAESKVEWGLSVVKQLRSDGADPQLIDPMCHKLVELDPPEPMLCDLLLELVRVSGSRVREARQLLTKVQNILQLKPDVASPARIGKVALMDSTILFNEGRFDAAEEAARKALSSLPEEETYFIGLAHSQLGWTEALKAQWENVERDIEQGTTLAKASNSGGLMPLMLNLEATVALSRGDLMKAEVTYSECAVVTRNMGQFLQLAVALDNLSLVMTYRGDFERAEKTAREAIRVTETFNLPTEMGVGWQILGYVRLQMGLPAEAMEFFKKAEKSYKEQGFSSDRMGLRSDMAEAKGSTGDPTGALKDLADIEKSGNLEVEAAAMLHIRRANILMAAGAEDKAKEEVDCAVSQSRERNLRYWEGKALLMLAEWEGRYGSPEKVVKAQADARKLLEACGVVDSALPTPGATGKTGSS